MGMIEYFSPTQTYVAGSPIHVDPSFIPRRGERGGRNIIQRMSVRVRSDITTGAGVTLDGNDLPSLLQLIQLQDAAGYRWNLTGPQTVLEGQIDMAPRLMDAPADLAANTANQISEQSLELCFSRPEDFGADDFSLPVDDLYDGGSIDLTWNPASSMPFAGGTGTVNAATYFVIVAHCREEFDVQLKARDVRGFVSCPNVSTINLPVLGNLVRSLYLHKEGADSAVYAGGGADLDTITFFSFDNIRVNNNPLIVAQQTHKGERGLTTTQTDDLVNPSRTRCAAVPLIVPMRREKMRDRLRVDGMLTGRLTNSGSVVPNQVYHFVTPRDQRIARATLVANRVPPNAEITVKTVGKSLRNPEAWDGYDAYMPAKANF